MDDYQLAGLKSKAIKGAGANIAAQVGSVIAHTVGVVVLARLLQPKDFGLVTMVTAISILLMNFGSNGFTEFIIQKEMIDDQELTNIFWLHGMISLILTGIFIAVSPLIAKFYNSPEIVTISIVLSSGIIIQALSTTQLAVLKRELEFGKIAIFQLTGDIISVILAVIMALEGMGYWAIVARQLTGPFLLMLGSWIISPWRPGLPVGLKNAGRGLRYAIYVYGNYMLGYLSRNLDKIVLGRYQGPQALGNYDRGYHLSSLPAEQLITPLHGVALSTLCKLRNLPEQFAEFYKQALGIIAFLGLLASLLITLNGRDIIFVLLGSKWEQAGWIVTAFGPGIGIGLISATHSWIHLSQGRPDRWLKWNIFALGFSLLIILMLAPYGGIYMAAGNSASVFVLMPLALWFAGKPIRLKILPLLKAIGLFLIPAIIVTLLWLGSGYYFKFITNNIYKLNPFSRICVLGLIETLLYLSLVIAFHRGLRPIKDILSLGQILMTKDGRSGP